MAETEITGSRGMTCGIVSHAESHLGVVIAQDEQAKVMKIRRPNRSALLIVDVQGDFCPSGALPSPGCDGIVPALNVHIARAVKCGMPVYASRDWHPEVTTHFKAFGGEWPPHCVQGTAGAEFHPGLRLPPDAIVITKGDVPERPGYSAFEGRTADGHSLAENLRGRRTDTLYVAGIATDYCVRQTVLDALREGFSVVVLTDAVSGIDLHAGDSDRALAEMKTAGARLATEIAQPGGRRAVRAIVSVLAVAGTIIAAFSMVRSSDRFRRGTSRDGVRRDPRLIGARRHPRKGDAA